jgi:hypothetical protein
MELIFIPLLSDSIKIIITGRRCCTPTRDKRLFFDGSYYGKLIHLQSTQPSCAAQRNKFPRPLYVRAQKKSAFDIFNQQNRRLKKKRAGVYMYIFDVVQLLRYERGRDDLNELLHDQ